MIINCPSCASHFKVDPQALEPAGRKVRCAKCGSRWLQPPADPSTAAADSAEAAPVTQAESAPAAPAKLNFSLVPTAMLFTAGISLGLTFSLNRIAITDGIPFVPYVFWQALGAGLILLILSLFVRRPPRLTPRHLMVYAVLGSIGMSVPLLVVNFVAAKLPAGVVGLQQTLVPMLTYAFALMLRVDKVNTFKLAGLGVGLSAVLVVVLPQTSLPSPDMVIWVLVSFITPLCYGMANVLIAVLRPPETTSLALASAILLTGAVIMGVVMVASGGWWWFDGIMTGGDWALIAVVLINAVFFWLLLEIIRLAGPVFFSVQNYIATLSGIAWGMLIHSEAHSIWIWLALVLLFVGLALVIRGSLQRETK
ncbi:MAG: EamA family transporter [Rhodospirillaceae bacterium]|nr:EamA family transporter [Rhodospirillaceae bacterium]MBT3627234.1 EamA family transporter [Rhodospirillaceae bacterium]MBT3927008.1 EamA family transporter [Rhodospirillaceae bacterium]MBT4427085.1 EamA family transporter [Rhodospirillaceae bacterium]MBT5675649.1 EamA family transporter [Rhodospirillaceae bacterium]